MRIKTLSWLAIAAILFMLAGGALPVSAVGEQDPPTNVHLTWKTADTARTITVVWQTLYENAGTTVWYDTVSHGENLSAYENASGSVTLAPDGVTYVHEVELTGLSPDTLYYFRCGGENGGQSQEWSFRTAPTTSRDITFVAGGDSRPPYPGEQTETVFPDARDSVSREMAKCDPEFVLYTGDFVQDPDNSDQWDNWFGAMQEYWVTQDNRMIPIIPCIGNHEIDDHTDVGENSALYYYGLLSLPENERWYSLDWGPDLHIISLNSEVEWSEMSGEQREWLESDLAAHANVKWTIAIFHRSPFSSDTHHGSSTNVRNAWVDLFDQYHVNLVITGHAHDYERTHPINYTRSSTAPQNSSNEGTVYLVSGGWGAPSYEPGEKWWTAHSAEKHHFLILDLSSTDGTLRVRAVDDEGSTFDDVTLPYQGLGGVPDLLLMAAFVGVIFAVIMVIYLRKRRKAPEPKPAPAGPPPAEPPPQQPPQPTPEQPPQQPPPPPQVTTSTVRWCGRVNHFLRLNFSCNFMVRIGHG